MKPTSDRRFDPLFATQLLLEFTREQSQEQSLPRLVEPRQKLGVRWQSAAATPHSPGHPFPKAAWRFASRRTPQDLCLRRPPRWDGFLLNNQIPDDGFLTLQEDGCLIPVYLD